MAELIGNGNKINTFQGSVALRVHYAGIANGKRCTSYVDAEEPQVLRAMLSDKDVSFIVNNPTALNDFDSFLDSLYSRNIEINNSLLIEKMILLELSQTALKTVISNHDLLPKAPEDLDSYDIREMFYNNIEDPKIIVKTNRINLIEKTRNYCGQVSGELIEELEVDWKSWNGFNIEHKPLTMYERGFDVWPRKILIEKRGYIDWNEWDRWEESMSDKSHLDRWEKRKQEIYAKEMAK